MKSFELWKEIIVFGGINDCKCGLRGGGDDGSLEHIRELRRTELSIDNNYITIIT